MKLTNAAPLQKLIAASRVDVLMPAFCIQNIITSMWIVEATFVIWAIRAHASV